MKKILLIDEQEDSRKNIGEVLELSNYHVLRTGDARKGIEMALLERPDLVICNILLSGMDGIGVLHSLRRHDATSRIPFIFLTDETGKQDYRRAMEAGADDYLTRPFESIELLKAVDTCLRKQERRPIRSSAMAMILPKDQPADEDIPDFSPILAGRDVISCRRKQRLYQEGHRPTQVYFIDSGKVKTYKFSPDGKELITTIYGAGDFIGYGALLEGTNFPDNAEVLEDARVLSIPRKEFLDWIAGDQAIAAYFIRMLARSVSEREANLLNLAYNSLRKRVANGLLHLSDKYRQPGTEGGALGITRENLAHLIGSATESLTRTLSDFRSERLIDIRNGRIYLLNETKLRNLVN